MAPVHLLVLPNDWMAANLGMTGMPPAEAPKKNPIGFIHAPVDRPAT
jgi:hypothetical protein